MAKEWYLLSSSTKPNSIGGYENEGFQNYKDDAFSEALETDIAADIILYNHDLSESQEIRCIIQGNSADTMLKSMERIGLFSIGTVKAGMYTKIWKELVSIILQLNAINNDEEEIDESKVKSKKALEILEKLKKGREANKKKNKADKALQLDNLVSVIANKHTSLNMTNIWNITVYQLWDAFTRMAGNNIYDMSKFTVSVWGDEKKQFNYTEWYKRIDN